MSKHVSSTTTHASRADMRKLKQYSIGFASSIVLTFAAYLLTVHHILTGWALAYVIVGLALAQVVVQLVFFLHIGHESEPRWNLLALDFTLIIVVILVIGSLWIMNHLDYNMHNGNTMNNGMNMNGQSPDATNNYIINDEGFRQK
jgi:cytochrome o ubiquinol oxidase operon protein cyoD